MDYTTPSVPLRPACNWVWLSLYVCVCLCLSQRLNARACAHGGFIYLRVVRVLQDGGLQHQDGVGQIPLLGLLQALLEGVVVLFVGVVRVEVVTLASQTQGGSLDMWFCVCLCLQSEYISRVLTAPRVLAARMPPFSASHHTDVLQGPVLPLMFNFSIFKP